MQIRKPQLVIVPDEDYEYGLNNGHYPEFNDELNSGTLVILSKEVATSEYGITQPEENKVYVLNQYDGIYYDLAAENLEILFMEKKAIQIREVLVMFGVYSATLENTVANRIDKDVKFNVYFQNEKGQEKHKKKKKLFRKKEVVSADSSLDINSQFDRKLATKIELKPSMRQAKTPQEIRLYINTHGLGEESSLIAWLERYERDGVMAGEESLEVSFLEDLAKVRNGTLKLKLLKAEPGFNIESNCKETRNIYKRISVDFSGPKE